MHHDHLMFSTQNNCSVTKRIYPLRTNTYELRGAQEIFQVYPRETSVSHCSELLFLLNDVLNMAIP